MGCIEESLPRQGIVLPVSRGITQPLCSQNPDCRLTISDLPNPQPRIPIPVLYEARCPKPDARFLSFRIVIIPLLLYLQIMNDSDLKNLAVLRETSTIILKRFENDQEPKMISISGAGGSGKSTFSRLLADILPDAAVLRLDDYKLPRQERERGRILGSDPRAYDWGLVKGHLRMIKEGNSFQAPVYDDGFGLSNRTLLFKPARFNMLDGELSGMDRLQRFVDLGIFIESGVILQFRGRFSRDTGERCYPLRRAAEVFVKSNLRDFRRFGLQGRGNADIVIRRSPDQRYHLSANRRK